MEGSQFRQQKQKVEGINSCRDMGPTISNILIYWVKNVIHEYCTKTHELNWKWDMEESWFCWRTRPVEGICSYRGTGPTIY